MTKFFGTIEFFVPGDDVESYIERIERLFSINATKAEDKVNYFLTLIGAVAFSKLKSLILPNLIKDMSYEDLKTALSNHYKPKRKVIAERYKFYKRNQKPGEPINDYILELKLLARTCNFENVDITLRDRLVMGLVDTQIQNKLLDAEDDLTLELALSKAANMELTSAEVKNIKPEKMDVNFIGNRGRSQSKQRYHNHSSSNRDSGSGSGAGNSSGHRHRSGTRQKNRYNSPLTCYICQGEGHIARFCRSKKRNETKNEGKRLDVKQLEDDDDDTVNHMRAITMNWVTLEEDNNTSN